MTLFSTILSLFILLILAAGGLFIIAALASEKGSYIPSVLTSAVATLLELAFAVYLLIVLSQKGMDTPNRYGDVPTPFNGVFQPDFAAFKDKIVAGFTHYFINVFRNGNYFNLKGRATRRQCWGFCFICAVLSSVPYVLPVDNHSFLVMMLSLIVGVACLAAVPPSIALYVRRLHDINRSGKWLFAFLGVFIVSLVLVSVGGGILYSTGRSLRSTEQVTRMLSRAPEAFVYIGLGIFILLASMMIFDLVLLRPPTKGANHYGDDPREQGTLSVES